MSSNEFDYIIVGGGIAGTVIASRLHERDPSLKVLLIEAGPDSSKTSLASTAANPSKVAYLKKSELDWDDLTVPQKYLDGRQIYCGGGKAIGGSSVINYGLWTRGDAKDYDIWADLVKSPRFSWEEMLPYFKKTETHYDPSVSHENHGHSGPVSTASVSSSGRNYPLREPLREAWAELGVTQPKDINDGSPLGLSEVVEARTKGQRVISSAAYPLNGVTVLLSTLAKRVLFTTNKNGIPTATGIELSNGETYTCTREVILSAGAFRTPQLLLLSGIGPSSELEKHSIPQIVESPDVGRNLWDHLGCVQTWKLTPKYASLGSSIGSPLWVDPKFEAGNGLDWYITCDVPSSGLRDALERDNQSEQECEHLLTKDRCHFGLVVMYYGFPMDGSRIISFVLNLIPTSRGTVSLRSTDVNEKPVIDNNHYETEADRYVLRTAVRKTAKLWETKAGKEAVLGEDVPEGFEALKESSTDEEVDRRIKGGAQTIQHPAGTASMGKVVDTEFRVKGVQGLRVVDASVIPSPISAPLQACVYALGELAVDLILGHQ